MPLVPLEGTGHLATAEDVAAPHLPAPAWPVSKPPLGSWEAVKGHGAHTLFVAPLRCPEQPPGTAVWLQGAGHEKGAKGGLPPAVPAPAHDSHLRRRTSPPPQLRALPSARRGVVWISGWIALVWGGIC